MARFIAQLISLYAVVKAYRERGMIRRLRRLRFMPHSKWVFVETRESTWNSPHGRWITTAQLIDNPSFEQF